MEVKDSVLAAIGNTPLIKLRRASEETGCTILGKAEFMNPGHSVKDRAALGIITDAIERGELRPGGLIVEGTAGNTRIGLAIVANALGMKTVIVIPETQPRKEGHAPLLDMLLEVPAVPYKNDNNYVKVAGRTAQRLAREHPHGAIFNQFDNVANGDVHVRTTGPEIWEQTEGASMASSAYRNGGTLAGVACAARSQWASPLPSPTCPARRCTALHHGELKAEGSSITEEWPGRDANLRGSPDHSFFIPDAESLDIAYRLLKEEGWRLAFVGRQCCRCDPAGLELRAGQDHRHHALRSCDPLSIAAVQPRIPAFHAWSHRTGRKSEFVEPAFA
jgi:cysteine synthase A